MLFQCNIQYTVYLLKKKMVITGALYFVDAKCFMLSMIQMLFVNCLQIIIMGQYCCDSCSNVQCSQSTGFSSK